MEQHHGKIFGQCFVMWIWNRSVRAHIPPWIFWYLKCAPKPSSFMCVHRDVVSNTNRVNLLNSFLCPLLHTVKEEESLTRGSSQNHCSTLLWFCQSKKCKGRGPWWIPASASLYFPISSLCFCSKVLKAHLGIKKGKPIGRWCSQINTLKKIYYFILTVKANIFWGIFWNHRTDLAANFATFVQNELKKYLSHMENTINLSLLITVLWQ